MKPLTIDFSNFFEYRRVSDSNMWMFQDAKLMINSLYREMDGDIEKVINNTSLINQIGSKILNINCYDNTMGEKVFNIPSLSQSIEEDVSIMDRAGNILRILFFDNNDKNLFLNNNSKIVLYNSKISIEQWDESNLQNRVNIIFNTILLFLVRKLKR